MNITPEVSLKIVQLLLGRTSCNEAEALGATLAVECLAAAVNELAKLKANSDGKS